MDCKDCANICIQNGSVDPWADCPYFHKLDNAEWEESQQKDYYNDLMEGMRMPWDID